MDDLQNAVVEAGTQIVMWLKLNAPLTDGAKAILMNNPTSEISVLRIGPPRDLRINRDGEGPELPPMVGDYEQPILLGVAPIGPALTSAAGAVRAAAPVAAQYVGAVARWATNLAKIGVAYVIGETTLNLTDPDTGPGAMLRLAFPFVLLILLYLIAQRRL